MVKTFCDVCMEPVNKWYAISVKPETLHPWQNVADIMPNCGEFMLCRDCYSLIYTKVEEENRKRREQ